MGVVANRLKPAPNANPHASGTAWGIWDKDGKKDIFGTLNLLTPEVIKEAYKEAKDGITVSLDWPLNSIKTPGFNRKPLVHKVMSFVDTPLSAHGYDDEIEINTQSSSQWDSLCHFHHQPSASAYNGIKTSVEELTQAHGNEDREQKLPTLNHWHSRGGLVARGVFIDYKSWADSKGISYSPFECHKITVPQIEEIAKAQNVTFRPGDVIIIRSGFTEALTHQTGEKQQELMGSHSVCGVTGDKETAKWFWNQHFAAVAGDMIAFEHIPAIDPETGGEATVSGLQLHQWFLALFGMPIGELWDLKRLSETCKRLGRYSFLLSSSPLNVPGAIGSPPNAIAMF